MARRNKPETQEELKARLKQEILKEMADKEAKPSDDNKPKFVAIRTDYHGDKGKIVGRHSDETWLKEWAEEYAENEKCLVRVSLEEVVS